jgi:hypothetical protein
MMTRPDKEGNLVARRLTREETRRVAEIQLSIKLIDADIHGSSSVEQIQALRARRIQEQAELMAIMRTP